jgi:hypothetical protein
METWHRTATHTEGYVPHLQCSVSLSSEHEQQRALQEGNTRHVPRYLLDRGDISCLPVMQP